MVLLQVRLLFQFFIFFFPNKKRLPLWQPLSLNGKWLSSTIAPDSETIFYGSLIPTASNRKYAKTNTAPFRTIPVITNHSFLDTMAKIIPSTESTVNTLMPNVKFALGPLIIKKKITFIITVNIDKNPNILFVLLFKIEPSIPLVIFQQSVPFVED